ncbi:MAG: transketolase, partial [Candidatus Marinimicrobia bacterium]|nr:transketolase [Candidatus Neomarinimicrobiota bacterium]
MAQSDISTLSINTIRLLSADAVQAANSGHPGMPMGMAPVAYVLWTKIMNYDPDAPQWPNRDRFILSAGHGSMLLYSILHLTGYDLSLDELKNFRQLGSKTPGHPEFHLEFGVETTTGPLGQGFSNGIGMALAAKHLGAVFNKEDVSIVDPTIYAIASDGDLMEGISHEAASLAGHLGLDNIIYVYDDNHISIEGDTDLAYSDNVQQRFESYGWHVQTVDDANDVESLEYAFKNAKSVTGQPHLISVRSHIGYGSPNQVDTSGVHGSPLGEDELRLTKENLGFDPDKKFVIPDEVKEHFKSAVEERQKAHKEWGSRLTEYKEKYPEDAKELERRLSGEKRTLNDDDLPVFKPEDGNIASRKASGKVIQSVAKQIPELIGGSADLAPSTKTLIDDSGDFAKGYYRERNLHFGVREHAMGGILNGMSLYR